MNKKQKIKRDKQTLKRYEQKMRKRPKDHTIGAEVYSGTDRRSRALALGECALQVMENFRGLQKEREEARHPLIEGSLFWMLKEDKVKDTDGRKGFHYRVMLKVQSAEPYYTEDEIREELHKTYLQFKAETEEMFGETTDEEYLEGERTHGRQTHGRQNPADRAGA